MTTSKAVAAAAGSVASTRDHGILLRSLYRAMSRHGKWFDATPMAKAVSCLTWRECTTFDCL